MKRILLVILLAFFCLTDVLAENNDTIVVADSTIGFTPIVKDNFDYKNTSLWNRNKIKTFSAGTLVGMGSLTLFYYALIRMFVASENCKDLGVIDAVFGGSSLAMLSGSIPLFISAHKDRKKAMNLTDAEFAQYMKSNRDYRTTGFRCELSAALTYPLSDADVHRMLCYGIAVEGRSYLGNSNFDLGVKFCYDVTENCASNRALRFSVLSDYNFCKGKKFNPYIGAGVGFAIPSSFFVEPRVGIQIYDHHRVSLFSHLNFNSNQYSDEARELSNLCLSYGYLF